MENVRVFKSKGLENKWLEKFEDLKYRFHDLFEDANKCLNEAYDLYKEVDSIFGYNKDFFFKIIHCISNIRSEIVIESEGKLEDIDLIYFIRNNMWCAKTEYQNKQLKWMEAKALSLNGSEFLNSAIHIYKELISYFKGLVGNVENEEELKKQLFNLGTLYIEIAELYKRSSNESLSSKYAELYLILYIDLHNSGRITKEEFDREYKAYKKMNGDFIGIEFMLIESKDKNKVI